MRVTRWLPALVLLLPGCAHLGAGPSEGWERARLWDEAHGYFATYDFERADSVFSLIAREHPETDEGRESLFYLGALRVDPRNPEWDAEVSEARLREYLAADSTNGPVHRRPEATVLAALVNQFTLPMEDRIPDLQAEGNRTVVIRSEEAPGTPAEVAQLRQQLEARDAEVKQLREELDRIRRTLTGGQ